MPTLIFQSTSEDQTIVLGEVLGSLLRPGDILTLDGELGAGKTRLVRGIALGLGLDPAQVSSPTYVIIHEYRTAAPHRPASLTSPLFHMDAYRLSGPDELDSLGLDRVMDEFGVLVVEWGDRVISELEPAPGRVRILAEGESERWIRLDAPSTWQARPEWTMLSTLAADQAQAENGHRGKARERGQSPKELPPGWTQCPTTGEPVAPDNPAFPFSSHRARLADLGHWLSGKYTITRPLTEQDFANLEQSGELSTPPDDEPAND